VLVHVIHGTPAATNDGREMYLHIVFVWDPELDHRLSRVNPDQKFQAEGGMEATKEPEAGH
jgi:hypothetical protein